MRIAEHRQMAIPGRCAIEMPAPPQTPHLNQLNLGHRHGYAAPRKAQGEVHLTWEEMGPMATPLD